ncbi:hypothetical protein ACWFOS_18895 [Gordonia terrae]
MATAFVERCKATYYAVRDAQLQRADEFAIGYDTDRAAYFDKIETRVLYRDVMVSVAAELRAEKAAERAEVERWERAERDHFSVYIDDAVSDDLAEDITRLFRTRFLALVWSAVQRPRRAVGVPVAPRRPAGFSRRALAGRCGPDDLADRDQSDGRGPPAQRGRRRCHLPPKSVYLTSS